MAFPRRMNLVDITVLPLNAAITDPTVDSDFREPVGKKAYGDAAGDPTVLRGQINFGRKKRDKRLSQQTGDAQESFGWCVFEQIVLDAGGFEPAEGDLIVAAAGRAIGPYKFTHIRPESPLREKFLLLYCEFVQLADERASIA